MAEVALREPGGFAAGEAHEESHDPDVSQDAFVGTVAADARGFRDDTDDEEDEDEARAADEDATALAVAAAGHEIDAFLASSDGTDLQNGDGLDLQNSVAGGANAESHLRDVLAKRDTARDAIAALTIRVEDMTRELDALDTEEALEALDEDEARLVSFRDDVGDGDGDGDAEYERERLEYERERGDEQWAEYDDDGKPTDDKPTSSTSPHKKGDRRRRLELQRDDAHARLSLEKRSLARLVPEMQNARKAVHDADRDAREIAGFDVSTLNDASNERRFRSQMGTAAASRDTRAGSRTHAADTESPVRRASRDQHGNARRVAHARAGNANSEVARASRAAARSRLRRKLGEISCLMAGVKSAERSRRDDDVRRILELKRNTDAAYESLSRAVAAKRSVRLRKDTARAVESSVLLRRGENPYEVFRKRDLDSRKKKEAAGNRNAHDVRMAEIRNRLQREERELDRREAETRRTKRTELFFKDGLGTTAQQQRNARRVSRGRLPAGAEDANARKYPRAGPLESSRTSHERELLRTHQTSANPAKGGGLGSGKSYERGWSWNGARAVGAAAPGKEKETAGAREPKSEEVFVPGVCIDDADSETRAARSGNIADLENARTNFANPLRLYRARVARGETFVGDSFAPSPKVVTFADFAVGKTYKRKVLLTNVSYAQSTFRVLPFTDHTHASVFTVEYARAGATSAGMSHCLTVVFAPTVSVEIDAQLPIRTTTGVVFVPIRCAPKTSNVRIVGNDLDFGDVVIGETKRVVAELRNEGAAAASFALSRNEENSDDQNNLTPEFSTRVRNAGKVLDDGTRVDPTTGVIPGYGSVFLDIAFTPRFANAAFDETTVSLALARDDYGAQSPCKNTELFLRSRGAGSPPPVHLGTRKRVDFKLAVVGCAYRDVLEVLNRGNSVAKVFLKPPNSLRNVLEIIPTGALSVQPGSAVKFQLKFKPTAKLVARFELINQGDDGNERLRGAVPFQVPMSVPCEVVVQGRKNPVPFLLTATLTTGDLTFTPSGTIDFRHVNVGETATIVVLIKNSGACVQKFGIVGPDVHGEVSTQNGFVTVAPSRYGEILPGETLAVEFGFAPKVVGRFQFSFQLKTLLGPGREFTLPCEGWGKDPALTVDGNVLTLPPTSAREASSGSVFISNHGKCEKTFEIVVPLAAKNRGLTVSPHVATLQPGERKRVRVEFCPPERDADCGDDSSGEGQDEDSSGEGKDEDSSGEGKEDDSGEGNDDDSTEGNEKGNDEKNDSRDDALPEIFRLALFAKNTNFLRDAAGAFESTNDEHPDEHPGDTNRDSHKNQNQPEETRTFAQHLEVRTATHVPAISVLGLPEFLLEETFGETDGRTVRNRLSKDTDGGTSEKTSENTLDETSKTSKETSSKDTVHPPGGVRFKKNRRLDRREKAFVMDFGIVAVGAGGLRRLLVKNETDATVVTKPSCFDHEGVFAALGAFRGIGGNQTAAIPMEFRPAHPMRYQDVFVLTTPVGTIRVVLKGEGVCLKPTLVSVRDGKDGGDGTEGDGKQEKNEDDENDDKSDRNSDSKSDFSKRNPIDCGDCVFGAQTTTTTSVRNPTKVPLKWSAWFPPGSVVAPTAGGTNRNPFIVSPGGGVLQPNAETEVSVTFSPHGAAPFENSNNNKNDLPLAECRAVLQVATTSLRSGGDTGGSAAGAPSSVSRRVVGRCWSRGAYAFFDGGGSGDFNEAQRTGNPAWCAPDGLPTLRDALRTPFLCAQTSSEIVEAETTAETTLDATGKAYPKSIVVTAPVAARFGGDPVVVSLTVGSAVGGDGGADVSYTVSPPTPVDVETEPSARTGWSCVSDRTGTVATGARTELVFSFAPPSEPPRAGDLAYFGVEEWVEARSTVVLKGGDPPVSGVGVDDLAVQITLRARLLPPTPTRFAKVVEPETAVDDAAAEGEDKPGEDEVD